MGKEMRNNKELARYQSELQVAENQRQEQFNADEWTRQFGMQEQQWQQHFAQESAYNSEQEKAKRLREVGVNPVAALSNTPTQNVMGGSSPQPSVSPRSGVVSSPAPYSSTFPQILNSLNDSVKALSGAGRNAVESNRVQQLLQHEIQKTIAETDNEREKAFMNRLSNMMTKEQWPYKVQMAAVEMYDRIQQIYTNYSKEKNYDADSFYKAAQAEFTDFLKEHGKKLEPWQVNLARQEAEWYSRFKAEEIKTMKSEQGLNSAKASEAYQSARGLQFVNDINEQNKIGIISMLQDDIQKSFNSNVLSGVQREAAEVALDKLKFEKDHQALLFWKDFVLEIVHEGVGIVEAFAKVKSTKAFEGMSDAQKKKVEVAEEEMKRKYSDKSEIDYKYDKNGNPVKSSARTTRYRK